MKGLSAPHARVIRDGVEKVIDAKDLVVGDIIKLEAGDFIPADAIHVTISRVSTFDPEKEDLRDIEIDYNGI